ncbi:MAG: ABC transporter permease [Lachnospiraceae bacterium]|jgi:peptide/nickel transport system permease protein|nr:ABC transporter permease [Lachnospiraceae bacterium]
MLRYVVSRILIMIPTVLAVIIIVFALSRMMPGDPVRTILGSNYTEAQYKEMSERMGLDKPYVVQLGNYLYNLVVKHDFGISYTTSRPVLDDLRSRMKVTFLIGTLSCLLTSCIAIPLGIISAVRQNSVMDYGVSFLSILMAALPNFWVALMCIILFCLRLGWLPATAALGGWRGYILPVVCNGTLSIAVTTRQLRSSMLDVVSQDYERTARAKGLSERQTIINHALKNALLPILPVLGTQFSMIIGGSVVIENIFSVPGMGSKLVNSINGRDYNTVLAITILISVFSIVVLLLVDIVSAFIDPRVKAEFASRGKKRRLPRTGEVASGR